VSDRAVQLRQKLGLITQEDLAIMLDVTVDTLRDWRRLKQGPDFVKMGKGVMYREVDIQEWLKLNVVPVIRPGGGGRER
jgi:hypothetical protein